MHRSFSRSWNRRWCNVSVMRMKLDVTALDETMEVGIVKSGLRDIHVCVKSRDDLLQAVQHEEEISRISEELDVVGVHMSCLNLPKKQNKLQHIAVINAPLYDIPEEMRDRNIERWIDLLSVSKRNDSGKSDELFLFRESTCIVRQKSIRKCGWTDGKPTIWVGGCGVMCW